MWYLPVSTPAKPIPETPSVWFRHKPHEAINQSSGGDNSLDGDASNERNSAYSLAEKHNHELQMILLVERNAVLKRALILDAICQDLISTIQIDRCIFLEEVTILAKSSSPQDGSMRSVLRAMLCGLIAKSMNLPASEVSTAILVGLLCDISILRSRVGDTHKLVEGFPIRSRNMLESISFGTEFVRVAVAQFMSSVMGSVTHGD